MSRETDEDRGFKVEDRRGVDPEPGDPPDDGASDAAPAPAADELPAIDFSTFILSLSTSAMVHMDEVPGPEGESHKNIQLAKQSIDILGLLRDKTAGNLTESEEKLLGDVLYDLRLKYVAAAK